VEPDQVAIWTANLGFPPQEVVRQTLQHTTRFITTLESENRLIMRDHKKARALPLRPLRINERAYTDTFISKVISVRGYHYFQLFSFEKSKMDFVYLMRRKSQAPEALADLVRYVGAPTLLFHDNSREQTSKQWTSILRSFCIPNRTTEPHHPQQNLAERRGGDIKAMVVYLLTITQCPLEYWCYCLEYVTLVRTVLARRSLDWLTPHEAMFGETPDISVFRFCFWQPVWFYNKTPFPDPRMTPARFLGVADQTGDGFAYLVLTVDPMLNGSPDPQFSPMILKRGVLRK
jgi:transposase InsO family protein